MTDSYAGLVGDGIAVLAVPRLVPSIGVELTTVAAGVAITSGGNPRRLMKAGWIAPSRIGSDAGWPATLFCEQARWVQWEREQITYPSAGVFADRIRYHFEPGVVASLYVNEVSSATMLNAQKMPWDRASAQWSRQVLTNVTGPVSPTTGFTYTVPAGKVLMLAHLDVRVQRVVVATTVGNTYAYGMVNGAAVVQVHESLNVLGSVVQQGLSAGPLYLAAGDTVSCLYSSSDTGGQYFYSVMAAGMLFNA